MVKNINKTNIPNLRFPQFHDEWEENRLGELCGTFKSGKSITSTKIFKEGTYPVYGGNGLRGFTESFTHNGDYFLIGRQGALCGNINKVSGKTFISEHAIAVQANKTSNTECLAQKLDYLKLNRLSESSAQPGLAVNKLIRLKIKMPLFQEQEKIASFLSVVDDKIQKLTRKKELLEQYKKGVMQKIFSQEIRFKDENRNNYPDWEEKKLSEVFSIFNGYAFKSTDAQSSGCKWVKIADVGINKMKIDNISYLPTEYKIQHHKFILNYKDFVIALTRPILNGKLKIAQINKTFDGSLLNQRVGKLISDNINEYVYHFLQWPLIISKIENRIAGTDPPNLSPNEMNSIKTSIPSLAEQKKIALFLSDIDKKIEAIQTQLEKTKNFKKGLLQKMFI